MSVSIIIPNYNGEKLLSKNLPKVLEAAKNYSSMTESEVEIIVIDDASLDNSINTIKNLKFKIKNENLKLKILQNEKNLGFSSTVNKGVKSSSADVVVLLNTDVYPKKDFLSPLIEHFKDSQVFAVGCLDKSIEDGKIIERGRGVGEWEKGFLIHKRGRINKNNTLWASGGSSAFRKNLWNKLGGFNSLYSPFYWEDIDLSYRALKSGFKVFFESKSVVYHEHHKGAISQNYTPFQIRTIAYKNQFIFVWINVTDINLQVLHFLFLPYHFFKALKSWDLSFFLGFLKALVLLPKIVKSSSRSQRFFERADFEVVKDFIE